MNATARKFSSARSRWIGVGPYYAMFPAAFCDHVVRKYTREGDLVIDPFAGRGTAVFSAASLNRGALGVEINPLGWLYGKTKLSAAPMNAVLHRLEEVSGLAKRHAEAASSLPKFFVRCFHKDVRLFLIAAREHLDWETDPVDRTLMSFVLINLHGKRHDALSNQMRQTKAMAPRYAIQWWEDRKLKPPKVDPVAYLRKKIFWRYAKGVAECDRGEMIRGDSSEILRALCLSQQKQWRDATLLLTSPPYLGITNYHYDQWLRLWLLGGRPDDSIASERYTGKFANRQQYEQLLSEVFCSAAKLMKRQSTIYVRTDRRQPTSAITVAALRTAFPSHTLRRRSMPYNRATQTALFGHFAPKFGEVDLILTRP